MSDSAQVYNIGRHVAGDILKHILLDSFKSFQIEGCQLQRF